MVLQESSPSSDSAAESCPLCFTRVQRTDPFCIDRERMYLACGGCSLVFVPRAQLPSLESERAHYAHHQNRVDDVGYRRFLSRALEAVTARVPPAALGLDFGCGPGPALAAMLREQSYHVALYDPMTHPEPGVLTRCYDFITCTEVVEHVHDAARTWQQLFDLLLPGGWLTVMTKRVSDRDAFARWHYKRDPTHVRFYSETTFQWIAERFGATLEIATGDVICFEKR